MLIRFFKSVWVVWWWAAASVFFFVPITFAGLVDTTGSYAFRLCQAWVWFGRFVSGVRYETVGLEKIDPSRSYIIISNHQSLYDIPGLMLGLGLQFRWVIKRAFVYVPLFGWALYLTRHVFIDRSQPKRAIKSMEQAVGKLSAGVSVAVFAEGTRSDTGALGEFKRGGFLMAVKGGLPILPVTINGSWRVMPDKRSFDFYPGPIQLVVSDPIETDGYGSHNLNDLISRTRDVVASKLDPEFPA